MRALPEAKRASLCPVQQKFIGADVCRWIPVSRGEHEQNSLSRGQLNARDGGGVRHKPARVLDRWIPRDAQRGKHKEWGGLKKASRKRGEDESYGDNDR